EVVAGLSRTGYKSVAVPGTVLGLDTLRERYGTMKREDVMRPAIRLAEDGFVLMQADADSLARESKALAIEPNVAAIFLNAGKPPAAGQPPGQKRLARHSQGHRQGGSGRLLWRRDCRRSRGGKQRQWRQPDEARPRRLCRCRGAAGPLPLSRLRHRLGPAA